MAKPLAGRLALVTGSVGGIGNAFARRLAEAGADVVMSGLEPVADVEATRQDMEKGAGVRVRYIRADLTKLADLESLTKQAAEGGPVHILVNNAVIRHFAPVDQFPPERWEQGLAVNVSAPFHLARLLLTGMRAAGYGRIFNMTSVYGTRATVNRVDYITAKHAIEGMTRAIAMETATDDNVSCHALCPGTVLTPNIEGRIKALAAEQNLDWEKAQAAFMQGKQPSGRPVEAGNVAEMLAMLCGPIGRDMNGSIIPIEGGWLAKA
ncbi:MAG: SDR family NAD(P)-dependent oxidoreductase [Alphaproteobacteria bacterium]